MNSYRAHLLFEYMSPGVPLSASDVSQIGEVIQDGINGLLFLSEDAQGLAAAIKILVGDPDLRSRLEQRARKDAKAKYSWEKHLPRLETLYESVLRRRTHVPKVCWQQPAGQHEVDRAAGN